jgi:RNA polymerase sigma factor (sigma-70 family)
MTPEESKLFSDFYHDNHSKLFIHAYAILRQQSLAEVAVQEAYRIACQNFDRMSKSGNPVGWMKKTIENTALHILRDQNRNTTIFLSLEELLPGKEPAARSQSAFELQERCLEIVSPEDFDFFTRIAMNGFSFLEEANRLGISISACYKRFERIRARLQKALQADTEEI